jgi:hypothetical protein
MSDQLVWPALFVALLLLFQRELRTLPRALLSLISGATSSWWRWAVVLTSVALYIASLTQIAFVTECCYVRGNTRSFHSLDMLVIGWAAVLESPLEFVFVIAGWACACAKSYRAAIIWAFLAIGMLAIPSSGDAAWIANPIIVTTWFLVLDNKQRAALLSAAVALALTLIFLLVPDVPLSDKLTSVDIMSYGIGYWLWIASAGLLAAGASADAFLFRDIAPGHR